MKLASFLTAAAIIQYTLAAAVINLAEPLDPDKNVLVDRDESCNCGTKCTVEHDGKFKSCMEKYHDLPKCQKQSQDVHFICLNYCRFECDGFTTQSAVAERAEELLEHTLEPRVCDPSCHKRCAKSTEYEYYHCRHQPGIDHRQCLARAEYIEFACLSLCGGKCFRSLDSPSARNAPQDASEHEKDLEHIRESTSEAAIVERAEGLEEYQLEPRSCDTVCHSLCVKESEHTFNQCRNEHGVNHDQCLFKAENAEFACLADCGHRCRISGHPPLSPTTPTDTSKRDKDPGDIQQPTSKAAVSERAEEPEEQSLEPRDCDSSCHSLCLKKAVRVYYECRVRPRSSRKICVKQTEHAEFECLLQCRHTCGTLGVNSPTKKPPSKAIRRENDYADIQDHDTCGCKQTCQRKYDYILQRCESKSGANCKSLAELAEFYCLVDCRKNCGQ